MLGSAYPDELITYDHIRRHHMTPNSSKLLKLRLKDTPSLEQIHHNVLLRRNREGKVLKSLLRKVIVHELE